MGIQENIKKIKSPVILPPRENHCYILVDVLFLMHIKHFDKIRFVFIHLCILVFQAVFHRLFPTYH